MNPCCFCFELIAQNAIEIQVVAADRAQEENAPRQWMWSHGECLSTRLVSGVAFDPEVFFA